MDPKLQHLPIVWAQFSSLQSNKELFRSLEVLTLPTVHFYDGSRGLTENFPCGPSKVPILKRKLFQFLNTRVDPETFKLKDVVEEEAQSEPRVEREVSIENILITREHLDYLRTGMPFFQDLTDEEFDGLLAKARLQTFDEGDVIMRQGMPGRTFFVIKSGVVEMSIKSRFEDPISTPPYYLGAVVNQLKTFDYFGERALSTGEPYAASFRVLEKTRCFAFNVEDIPESSILSKKRGATREMIEKLSQRYELPEDYAPSYPPSPKDESILELLVRFKQIRQAAKCFNYIMNTEPKWGDQGEIARRSMLVSKLSKSQRDEFQEVFSIVDDSKSGKISLLEMRKFMESAREKKTDIELLEMISRAHPLFNRNTEYGITLDEFMGVMAEAEFYSLFTEMFQALDQDNTGYVRAGDLDEVLGGVRDLISNDRKSIIDVEDKDMQVDYEQFSKMLLGAAI
jgi:calmodulin